MTLQQIPLYQIDAFAESVFQGNPAAVCPLEDWLPERVLQSVAAENNLSETAYVVRAGDSFHIRWFTPRAEVDLCGHATLATAHVLFFETKQACEVISFESNSGPLSVRKRGDSLQLDFPSEKLTPIEAPSLLLEGLGVMPLGVFQGEDIMVVLRDEEEVQSMVPSSTALAGLSCRGICVTAPGKAVDFVSRAFFPRLGIEEDPVTGSAHCYLAPYWAERLKKPVLQAQQLSARGGALLCECREDRVLISGKTALYLQGTIFIPSHG